MGRCTVIRWAFAAGVLCCWGCSAPNSFSPFGWMQRSNSAQATASKDPANPLKPSGSSASGSSSSSGDTSTASNSSADGDKAAARGGYKSATIDPALKKLMMDELAYEPADKREKLFEDWAKFDPSFIRELVENHRMARELAESHRASGNTDWANAGTGGGSSSATVRTASNEAPGLPAFDDPTAPKDSVLRERTAGTTPVQPASPTLSGVSPWDDAPARPAANKTTSAVAPSAVAQVPAMPAAPVTPPAAPAANPFDPDIAPSNSAPTSKSTAVASGGANQKPGLSAAAPMPSPFDSMPGMPPATATPKPAPAGPGDAFAGLPPVDTEPAPTSGRAQSPTAPSPKVVSASSAAPAQPAQPNPFADGPSIQPGVAAPANAVANVQPPARGTGSPVTQAVATGPFDASGVALASATAPSTQPNTAAPEQPVKLGPPVDLPDGQVVPASDPGTTGAAAAQASATGASTNPPQPAGQAPTQQPATNQQPSSLAALSGRLLGAINPLPGANGSRNVVLPANWHDELQKIVAVAAAEAGQTSVGTSDAEKLAYIQKQVNLRMLYLLSGQPARSLEPIAGLEPADQEFWQEVFWGVSSYFDRNTIADPRDRATQTIAQLRAAVHKLQEKSKLELRNVAFCNKIENYGRYERFKRDEFTAGQPVLLYAEVENFKSEPTADGPYRVILKSSIEIFDSGGKLVKSMPFPPNEDLCASPRRDYYNSYEFSIPPDISLGPHTLKLTVEDQLSQKVASYTVNFTVK